MIRLVRGLNAKGQMSYALGRDGTLGSNMSFIQSFFNLPIDINIGAWLFWSLIIGTLFVAMFFIGTGHD